MPIQKFDPNKLDDEFHKAQKTVPENPSLASKYIVIAGTVGAIVALTSVWQIANSTATSEEPAELRLHKQLFQEEIDKKWGIKRKGLNGLDY
ncbi:MAG: hypothetical protein MRY79_01620 [Alphaproteobacteria bacterium]|nr:hypothetical protein [Alphaproteobacteria bacterium]